VIAVLQQIALQVIVAAALYIILEAILTIRYHKLNTRTKIAHLGRVSRIVAGTVIIILVVII
jgi:hypothetical protein